MDTTQSSLKNSFHLAQQLKQMRSNSWSDSLDDFRLGGLNEINRSLLGDSQKYLYDSFKKCYAEILYCWGFLVERTHVLKFLSVPPRYSGSGVDFVVECCDRPTKFLQCSQCKKLPLVCSICRLPVRGSAVACLVCRYVVIIFSQMIRFFQ